MANWCSPNSRRNAFRNTRKFSRIFKVGFRELGMLKINEPGQKIAPAQIQTIKMKEYNACYTPIPSGYMGQLLDWPEVVTEGTTIEECTELLQDALNEMIQAYSELGKPIPKP